MSTITIEFTKRIGKVKPMHAVNNGPIKGSSTHQSRSNFEAYKAACIPYARNHDASFCAAYGGEHTVDVHAIFPDFTKNPYHPDSYDFTYTDDYLSVIEEAGTKTFYRLGTKIEHGRKKYGTIVPADFHKWAVICEHIIRHYTQGWANGFHFDIEYWEIWNEADGKEGDDQPNWSGTPEEYYELYTVTAKHLKSRFPHLKIGGPALSWLKNVEWWDGFLASLTKGGEKVPMDFFSWHMYDDNPRKVAEGAALVHEKLAAAGYAEAENILNEYNYLENWTDKFVSTIEAIISMRGAAFTAAAMAAGQASELDMLMYYDARPSGFNGLFDMYTYRVLKGYYPFLMFSKLYKLGNSMAVDSDDDEIYVVAASGEDCRCAMVTYYSLDKEGAEPKKVTIRIPGENMDGKWECSVLDKEHTMEKHILTVTDGEAVIEMQPDCVVLLEKQITAIEYGRMACETIMQKYDAPKLPPYRSDENLSVFTYHQGVFLSGMNRIYQKTGEQKLFDYIKNWVDATLDENGHVRELGGWVSLETLDFRQPGILMFPLYEATGDEKYMENAAFLAESLKEYPTNSKGGFWHMKTQKHQMWLDGLYMAGPLMVMYGDKFNKPEFFDIAANQVIVMYENMLNKESGLMVHGWDESKEMGWADPETGRSGEIWGRAMGWYVTALADILDYIPVNHEKRQRLIEIERALLEAIAKYQDEASGRWYDVVDKGGCEGNWLENSCSCLFVYAFSKAIKKGYLAPEYYATAKKGYDGVINSLTYDEEGRLQVGDICIGTCIDEGTYEHYINREVCVNDLHGSGAFVLMCSEYEER